MKTAKELIEMLSGYKPDTLVLMEAGGVEPRDIKFVEHYCGDNEMPECLVIHPKR